MAIVTIRYVSRTSDLRGAFFALESHAGETAARLRAAGFLVTIERGV